MSKKISVHLVYEDISLLLRSFALLRGQLSLQEDMR